MARSCSSGNLAPEMKSGRSSRISTRHGDTVLHNVRLSTRPTAPLRYHARAALSRSAARGHTKGESLDEG